MSNVDYSKYRCPFDHIEKDCGHKLKGQEGYSRTYGVWCECGFRGPVFVYDPEELNLEPVDKGSAEGEDTVMVRVEVKNKIKLWLDANVWDGENRSGCKGDSAAFNPDDLQELCEDLVESITEIDPLIKN